MHLLCLLLHVETFNISGLKDEKSLLLSLHEKRSQLVLSEIYNLDLVKILGAPTGHM